MEIGSARLVLVEWPRCFPCGTSFGRGAFSTAMWHAGSQGQESAAGLVRTVLCRPEGDFRQTRRLTAVQGSIRLIVGDRNRLSRRVLDIGAADRDSVIQFPTQSAHGGEKFCRPTNSSQGPMPGKGAR